MSFKEVNPGTKSHNIINWKRTIILTTFITQSYFSLPIMFLKYPTSTNVTNVW